MKQLKTGQPEIGRDMHAFFCNAIVGQRHAIDEITRQYVLFAAGLTEPDTPAATMLLAGPTGVGKTEFAYACAEHLCGTRKALVKIDCGEYQYGHEIAKLIGSPPGYLGHKETRPLLNNEVLTQFWNDNRTSVVLFDEIEKGHSSLQNLLLGILDKSILTTGTNDPVDFSRAIILMSTNTGFAEQGSRLRGFVQSEQKYRKFKPSEILESIKRTFSPEFLNRIKGQIVFDYIDEAAAHDIAVVQLEQLRKRVEESSGIVLAWNAELPWQLVKDGYDMQYGARNIRTILYRRVVPDIACVVLDGLVKAGETLTVRKDFSLTKGE